MQATLTASHLKIPLLKPYALPFGTIDSLATTYVSLRSQGRTGWGEITPLPGYSSETSDSVAAALQEAVSRVANGEPYESVAQSLWDHAPFAASGMLCALETWRMGGEDCLRAPLSAPVPLAAICQGHTPEHCAQQARELLGLGFSTLKMKVGLSTPEQDAQRVIAVSQVLPEHGKIRLDANQVLDYESAIRFCEEIVGITCIQFLEQPFLPSQWRLTEKLISNTSLPIMLDEAIWDEGHVQRAADCGSQLIKAKLAKHRGVDGTRRILSLARSLGLGVVFGNGVQTALGNYLELKLHNEFHLSLASESNGFLKHSPALLPGLRVDNGHVQGQGLEGFEALHNEAAVLAKVDFDLAPQ